MKVDLEKMSRKELEALRKDVDKALNKVGAKEKKAARKAAEEAAAKFGFALAELGVDGGGSGGKRTVGKPKYANPQDESQTWTGKGRQPAWFRDRIAAGDDPESMAIGD